jgi:hypothetical protein
MIVPYLKRYIDAIRWDLVEGGGTSGPGRSRGAAAAGEEAGTAGEDGGEDGEDGDSGDGEGDGEGWFYLFHHSNDVCRPHETSTWSKVVKNVFKKYSPNGTETPPKLLRSSFITFVRSSNAAPEVLKAERLQTGSFARFGRFEGLQTQRDREREASIEPREIAR